MESATPNERAVFNAHLSWSWPKWENSTKPHAALQATQLDRTYVKGWWRLGQALSSLKDFEGAVEAMEKALMMDPSNKALTKELDKLREEAAKAPTMEVEEEDKGPKTEPAPPRSEIFKPKPAASPQKDH